MLNIVIVEPNKFAEMVENIPKEKRFVLPEFPATNLYLMEMRTLIVLKDEVFCREFPQGEHLSIASAVHEGWKR